MLALGFNHPDVMEQFVKKGKGHFTINRNCSPWVGVWSDIVIQQTFMHSMKSFGGLTRGREMNIFHNPSSTPNAIAQADDK
ncbi:hypothetical protein AVEN_23091-1 [Araneus ventricosus]|uniref:Uncharacterized protein n=1 Tax=Araneus ventricosus TaxID=182803 RepID=A0A4Y2X8L6_ARAVE|nr:hypothetical protein AVEN_23091-1 [Araneus ventricosus]